MAGPQRHRTGWWSALLALVIQALLPFGLGLAVQAAHSERSSLHAPAHHAEGHHHGDRRSDESGKGAHRHGACPMCAHVGIAKFFALPPAVALPGPRLVFVDRPAAAAEENRPAPRSSAFHSPRAPPELG
jgi:hypothetical protein